MHPEALAYVAWARNQIPAPVYVLELGSYNVNGSTRTLFPEARWHGIDVRGGPGVDEIADARDYPGVEAYDLVVCTEMLEHCENAEDVFVSAYRNLRRGGHLIATMAGEGRAPHNGDGDCFDPSAAGAEFYRNISEPELRHWLAEAGLIPVHIEHLPLAGDLRCIARKAT